jgi:hypothetical protein
MTLPIDAARDWECGTGMGAPVAHTLPLKKLVCGYVWVDAVEAGEHVEGVVG